MISARSAFAIALLASVSAGAASAAAPFTTLYQFTGGTDAGVPLPGLVMDANGALYGTTSGQSNASGGSAQAAATVYQLSPPAAGATAWTETVLHSFALGPNPGLIFDTRGNLFGTTYGQGSASRGSVYKLKHPGVAGKWLFSNIFSFHNLKGNDPFQLLIDAEHRLFGLTEAGGPATETDCGTFAPPCGVAFRLTPPATSTGTWVEKVLYDFGQGVGAPTGPLVADATGNLYGTTLSGAVFELTQPASHSGPWTFTLLHQFTDGSEVNSGLTMTAAGVLYGSTDTSDAATPVDAKVFSLTPPATAGGAWTYAVVHTFAAGVTPQPGLLVDASGDVFLAAQTTTDAGKIVELTPMPTGGSTQVVLHTFTGAADGSTPNGGLFADSTGAIYGTTQAGALGFGTVFTLTP